MQQNIPGQLFQKCYLKEQTSWKVLYPHRWIPEFSTIGTARRKNAWWGAKKHRKVTEVGDSEDKKKVLNKSNQ